MSKQLERACGYRKYATELLKISERTADIRQRALWLELAATYHRMASQLEEIHRLDVEPTE